MSMRVPRPPCRCEAPNLGDALYFSGPEFRQKMRAQVGVGLREWRERRGLGLREAARLAGVDPSNLHKLEGGRVWSDTIVKRITETLTVSASTDE